MASAIKTLKQIGALNEKENLTALGQHLATLPVDVRVGKMLLYGAVLGCLSPVLTIAAVLGGRAPFVAPLEKRDEADAAKRMFAEAERPPDVSQRVHRGNAVAQAWRCSSPGRTRASARWRDATCEPVRARSRKPASWAAPAPRRRERASPRRGRSRRPRRRGKPWGRAALLRTTRLGSRRTGTRKTQARKALRLGCTNLVKCAPSAAARRRA